MKLTVKKVSKTARVLVYGPPKSGKTELVGKLAEKFNLLWFDLENGYATLLKLQKPWQERIEIVSIPDTKVFPIAIETMLKVITGAKIEICDEHGKVSCHLCKKANTEVPDSKTFTVVHLNELPSDTIAVVDSLTQLSNSAMNFLTKNQDDLYKPEWGDYRNQGQLLDKFLSQVQQAEFNIVCITHEVETEMEDGKKKLVPVAGTTNFSRNTAKYFDHVVYCEVKNRKHNFASGTVYANNILTGSRTDVELEKDDKPSLLRIFSLPSDVAGTQVSGFVPTSVPADSPKIATTPAQNALAALRSKVGNK